MSSYEQLKVKEELIGRNGQAIIGEVWLKPRCIASNYWGINSVREIFKAKSMRFMHA